MIINKVERCLSILRSGAPRTAVKITTLNNFTGTNGHICMEREFIRVKIRKEMFHKTNMNSKKQKVNSLSNLMWSVKENLQQKDSIQHNKMLLNN